jgi:hypothetical protein
MNRSHVIGVMVAVVLVACGGRGLNLTMIDASVQRPSNVAVYFTVDTAEGEPVPGLNVMAFKIYEDGQPISALESQQTILNPEVSASHFTLLLIDMSGSVTGSGDLPVIVEAAKGFSQRVELCVRRIDEHPPDRQRRSAREFFCEGPVDELERRDRRRSQGAAPADELLDDAIDVRNACRVHRRHRPRRPRASRAAG